MEFVYKSPFSVLKQAPKYFSLLIAFLLPFHVHGSLPEPSFVVHGEIRSANQKIERDGMLVSASRSGVLLADAELNAVNAYNFFLEIPLEATIGPRSLGKARVGDVIDLRVSGEIVANIQIDGRGVLKRYDLPLPEGYDSDGDGVYDSLEIASGLDPDNPDDPVRFGDLDLDGDGISNGSEFLSGTYDPDGDYDGDGFSNQDEYILSKNPASALSMPAQYADIGLYSPLVVDSAAFEYLKDYEGADYTWDEQVNGRPVSIVPALWNVDTLPDLLISTSQGKLFYCEQLGDNRYAAPELVSLFSVPVSGDLYVGFANFDGANSEELWAYSTSSENLYIFKRSPQGIPHGSIVWQQVALGSISGGIDIADMNGDSVPDILVSGFDIPSSGYDKESVISLFSGAWDGINYTPAAAKLLVANTTIYNNPVMVFPNIGEAGFDNGADYLIRKGHRYIFSLSYNGGLANDFSSGAWEFLFASGVGITEPEAIAPLIKPVELVTGGSQDAWAFYTANDDGYTDLLQYMGSYSGYESKFRIVKGFRSVLDSDGDGIKDYLDKSEHDPDVPLPQGNVDFDGDGIPYGVDVDRSGQEDADSDGMNDAFELTYGLDPLDATDANSDADADGRTAVQEYQDNTDPNDTYSAASVQVRQAATISAFPSGASDLVIVNGAVAVSSATSKSVRFYEEGKFDTVRTIEVDDNNGVAKMMSTDDQLIVGTVGGALEIWDATNSTRLARFDNSNASVTDMAVSGSELYTLHADGHVYHWDLTKLIYVSHWKIYDGVLTNINVEGSSLYIQASFPEKMMFVWDLNTKGIIYTIAGSASCCARSVSEKAGGSRLLVANSFNNSGIYSMDLVSYNSNQVVDGIDVSAMKVNNGEVYVGRKTGLIDRYQLDTGAYVDRVVAPAAYVRKIESTPGGFVSLHSDGNLYFWEHNR